MFADIIDIEEPESPADAKLRARLTPEESAGITTISQWIADSLDLTQIYVTKQNIADGGQLAAIAAPLQCAWDYGQVLAYETLFSLRPARVVIQDVLASAVEPVAPFGAPSYAPEELSSEEPYRVGTGRVQFDWWKPILVVVGTFLIWLLVVLATNFRVLIQRSHPDVTPPDMSISSQETAVHTLNDGTVVTMNAGSQLVYRHSMGTTTPRTVALTGEAAFEPAAGDALSTRFPFTVTTEIQVERGAIPITVVSRGAAYDVRAYPDEHFAQITVSRGTVAVWGSVGDSAVDVPVGMTAVITSNAHIVIASSRPDDLLWTHGTLTLDGVPLPVALREISRRYGVTVRACDGIRRYDWVHLKLYGQPLDSALSVIERQTYRASNKLAPTLIGLGALPDLVHGTKAENAHLLLTSLIGRGCHDAQ